MLLAHYLTVIKRTVLLSGALFIAMQLSAAEHIAPPPHSSIENSDLQHWLADSEIKPILAGESEFLTLYSEYMSADFRGIAILIPDWQSAPTNNAGMGFLRKELNNLGYTTYAMTVPNIDWQASQSAATDDNLVAEHPSAAQVLANNDANETSKHEAAAIETSASNSANIHPVTAIAKVTDAVLNDYKANLIARFKALYQAAMTTPTNIVVIAQGTSAGVMLEHYADFPEQHIAAFISLSSYLPNAKRNAALSQTTSLVTPALLDIYYAHDNNEILMSLDSRQRWVNRNAKFDYRQRQLFGQQNQPDQHARLSKEIDGFLRRLF
jgi:hypothetical protein